MVKPNEKCPCKSGKKYKKCCKKKGLFTKKSAVFDPSTWKNLGESHPSLRFAVGDRVEGRVGESDSNGDPKWTPCTIRHVNFVESDGRCSPYVCLSDYPVKGGRLLGVPSDINDIIRPLGFTKSVTHKTDPCATCGVNEPTEGEVTFVQCGGCRRTRYCTRACQKIDWKKHRVLCEAIVKQNESKKEEINDIIKSGKAEAVNNALIEAAKGGNLLVVKKLFKKRGDDIDVNALTSDGATAVYYSSFRGHIDITTFLLQIKGIDVNKPQTEHGATPLHVASQNGHVEIVTMLLGAEGIQVNKSNKVGATPLFFASQFNQIEIVKLLLGAEGIEMNQPMNNGATALAIAKQKKHTDIIQLLIAAGATV
jgi:hypothetical protein